MAPSTVAQSVWLLLLLPPLCPSVLWIEERTTIDDNTPIHFDKLINTKPSTPFSRPLNYYKSIFMNLVQRAPYINWFCIEFSGLLDVSTAGNYSIKTVCDDGMQVVVNSTTVVENKKIQSNVTTHEGQFFAQAGLVEFRVLYLQTFTSTFINVSLMSEGIKFMPDVLMEIWTYNPFDVFTPTTTTWTYGPIYNSGLDNVLIKISGNVTSPTTIRVNGQVTDFMLKNNGAVVVENIGNNASPFSPEAIEVNSSAVEIYVVCRKSEMSIMEYRSRDYENVTEISFPELYLASLALKSSKNVTLHAGVVGGGSSLKIDSVALINVGHLLIIGDLVEVTIGNLSIEGETFLQFKGCLSITNVIINYTLEKPYNNEKEKPLIYSPCLTISNISVSTCFETKQILTSLSIQFVSSTCGPRPPHFSIFSWDSWISIIFLSLCCIILAGSILLLFIYLNPHCRSKILPFFQRPHFQRNLDAYSESNE